MVEAQALGKVEIHKEGARNSYRLPDRSKATTAIPWSYERQQFATFELERTRRELAANGKRQAQQSPRRGLAR